MRISELGAYLTDGTPRQLILDCPSCHHIGKHQIAITLPRHFSAESINDFNLSPAVQTACPDPKYAGFTFEIRRGWIYPLDSRGNWYPHLFPEQLDIFNCFKRFLLAAGPSLSGKTLADLHKICRHLFETPNAVAGMFSKTLKSAKVAGTWMDLHKLVIPEWLNADIGFKYTTMTADGEPGWKIDGTTRTPFFTIRNKFGGESECWLFSLDHDDDIEDKIKEARFSLIYFAELSKFLSRKVFSISKLRLRMPHLRFDQHQWLADTNPSDEGETSWIYQTWLQERVNNYEWYVSSCKKQGIKPLAEQKFTAFQKQLALFEIKPAQNPHLAPEQLDDLEMSYHYDPILYAIYVEGKWIFGGDATRHFRGIFSPHIHVVGNIESISEGEWSVILPSPNTHELICGFDMGDTWHAACIFQRTYINNRSFWEMLAECVVMGEEVSNVEFTKQFMELIEGGPLAPVFGFEEIIGHRVELKCWSDRSSLENYSATGGTYPYKEVWEASNGRVELQGVPKPKDSVRSRVLVMKQVLNVKNPRIAISANCTHAIEMFGNLRKGPHKDDFVIHDRNKHIFDAMSYVLLMEEAEEIDNLVLGGGNRIDVPRQPAVVSIR